MRICDCRIFRIFQKNALRIFFSVNMAFSTAILISFVFLYENAKYADILALQIENIQKRATEMLSKAATNKLVNSQINYPPRLPLCLLSAPCDSLIARLGISPKIRSLTSCTRRFQSLINFGLVHYQ